MTLSPATEGLTVYAGDKEREGYDGNEDLRPDLE